MGLQCPSPKLSPVFVIIASPLCVTAPCGFFSMCCCVSWDVAQEISLHSDDNFLSGLVEKGPHASGPVPDWK